jgi:hypothetical protein
LFGIVVVVGASQDHFQRCPATPPFVDVDVGNCFCWKQHYQDWLVMPMKKHFKNGLGSFEHDGQLGSQSGR